MVSSRLTSRRVPGIWVRTTDERWNRSHLPYADWLTQAQQNRLERIRQARLLFDGNHREYYLDENRTQYDYRPAEINGEMKVPYDTMNILGLISVKSADLLLGEAPILRADDEIQQFFLDELVDRSKLHQGFYGGAVDCSYEAETFFETCIHNGEVYINQVPADEIFPQGQLMPDGQYRSYIRYRMKNIGTEEKPIMLLLEIHYEPGMIRRELYQLMDGGRRRAIDLAQWVNDDGSTPDPQTATGISDNTITWIPNLLIRSKPVSDYDGAIDAQDKLNAKNTQLARVISKHADPKLNAPAQAASDGGIIYSSNEVFFFSDPAMKPEYLTWDSQSTAALEDRKVALNMLLIKTETSPVLLGLKEGAAPDAYKKVRLEAFNSLTKAARKSIYWRAGIRRCVEVAQSLEQTIPGVRYDRGPIGVELRDGIPQDISELVNSHATLRSAGLISRRRALTEILIDPAAVDDEMDELAKEDAERMPTSFFGGANLEVGENVDDETIGVELNAGDEA